MSKKKKNKNLIKVDQNIFYSNVERRLAMKHALIAIIDLHISCEHGHCPTCEVESPCETALEIDKVIWAISS
jgi:ferredoxin